MTKRKRIVFDFGGVLFRWQPEALLRKAIAHIATDDTSARHWKAQIFGADWSEFDRGTVEANELVQRLARRTGLAAADVQRVVDRVPNELAPIDETVRWLAQLRAQGRTLHFLSNMPAPYAAHLERTHRFIDWFDGGVISSRVHHIKPERKIFELAAARFGAAPADLVFLDDHAANVESARSLGWHAIRFTDAAQAQREVSELLARAEGAGP